MFLIIFCDKKWKLERLTNIKVIMEKNLLYPLIHLPDCIYQSIRNVVHKGHTLHFRCKFQRTLFNFVSCIRAGKRNFESFSFNRPLTSAVIDCWLVLKLTSSALSGKTTVYVNFAVNVIVG